MAIIMNGATIQREIFEKLKKRIEKLDSHEVKPTLAIISVGNDYASGVYIRAKEKACNECGIKLNTWFFPETIEQQTLIENIKHLNAENNIHGIMVQLPIPGHLDAKKAIDNINPCKDVDGLTTANIGLMACAEEPSFYPCTPKGILYLLKRYRVSLEGKNAVIVGRSNIVGKPMGLMLLKENCTVTICHSHTKNLADYTRQADILISAVGKPQFITRDMVKTGAAVIDVGISRVNGRVVGDVDFQSVEPIAHWISPVPGGVGRMTVAMLMENVVEAAEKYAIDNRL